MANVNDFVLGTVVSFDVYPTAVLGTGFKRVKVLAILDMDTAKQWIDPLAMHINVFPTLPQGSIDDPSRYYYLKVETLDGNITCIGLPWIREESITVHESHSVRITIDDVSVDDVAKIRRALNANGYNSINIELV